MYEEPTRFKIERPIYGKSRELTKMMVLVDSYRLLASYKKIILPVEGLGCKEMRLTSFQAQDRFRTTRKEPDNSLTLPKPTRNRPAVGMGFLCATWVRMRVAVLLGGLIQTHRGYEGRLLLGAY